MQEICPSKVYKYFNELPSLTSIQKDFAKPLKVFNVKNSLAVAGWACALPGADSAAEQVLGEWTPIPVRECPQGVLGHRRRARTEQEYTVKSR